MVKKLTDEAHWPGVRQEAHKLLDARLDRMEMLYRLTQVDSWWQRLRANHRLEVLLHKITD